MDRVTAWILGLLMLSSYRIDSAVARQTLQADECSLQPQDTQLDFTGVVAGCSESADACTTCVCAVNEAFLPAFKAAGITFNNPDTFNVNTTNEVLYACAVQYAGQLIAAQANIQRLTALETLCPAGVVPECLPPILEQLSATPNVTAADSATSPSPARSPATAAAGNGTGSTSPAAGDASSVGQPLSQSSTAVAATSGLPVAAMCLLVVMAYAAGDHLSGLLH